MKGTLTQSMAWLHTWCGLLLGWVLFAIFLTGTLAVFDKEISWWMQPELIDRAQPASEAANLAHRWLTTHHPDESNWNVSLPSERSAALGVSVGERRRGGEGVTHLDPLTGDTLEPRETMGGNFFFRFHFSLNLPNMLGIWVVGLAAMAMLVALISGIVIHKKIFKEFFTFRPAKGQRSWLDAHNASAVLLLPFHLMITYTGLVIFFLIYMPAAVDALFEGDRQAYFSEAQPTLAAMRAGERTRPTEAPAAPLVPLGDLVARAEARFGPGMIGGLAVANPGRANAEVTVRPVLGHRIELTKGEAMVFNGVTGELIREREASRTSQLIQQVMAGLHFAQFGGYPMRWLYFLCGLISSAMIATGLVLYTVKQRRQGTNHAFLKLVESLNVSVIAGLALACIALLWANRLLPTGLEGRLGWELRLFFGVWALTWAHGWVRKPMQAWREQLYAAAALALGLPALDVLTGSATDTVRLSLLACVVAMGLGLGWTAWKIPAVVAARKARAARTAPIDKTPQGVSS